MELDDGGRDRLFGIFFTSNPHLDPLLPNFLESGHEVRDGPRFSPTELYPMADWIIRTLLSMVRIQLLKLYQALVPISSKSLTSRWNN
jgi:hypothetical protein